MQQMPVDSPEGLHKYIGMSQLANSEPLHIYCVRAKHVCAKNIIF